MHVNFAQALEWYTAQVGPKAVQHLKGQISFCLYFQDFIVEQSQAKRPSKACLERGLIEMLEDFQRSKSVLIYGKRSRFGAQTESFNLAPHPKRLEHLAGLSHIQAFQAYLQNRGLIKVTNSARAA